MLGGQKDYSKKRNAYFELILCRKITYLLEIAK